MRNMRNIRRFLFGKIDFVQNIVKLVHVVVVVVVDDYVDDQLPFHKTHQNSFMAQQQLNFGSALWDNLPAIEAFNVEGHDFLVKFSDFCKKRAQIQVSYSKELQKLVEGFRDTNNKKKKKNDLPRYV